MKEKEEIEKKKLEVDSEDYNMQPIKFNENKKQDSRKKYHYIIAGLAIVVLIYVYIQGNSFTANIVGNHLEGICDDVEGLENEIYSKNQVLVGSDETGRIGFTDICLKEMYDGRLDEVGLLFYLNNIAKYVQFDSNMAKDMDVLLEGFCPESLNQNLDEINPFMLITPYKCPKGCDNGACIQ